MDKYKFITWSIDLAEEFKSKLEQDITFKPDESHPVNKLIENNDIDETFKKDIISISAFDHN